jgi:DNA-binding XRE family transcriptional regulator
MKKHHTERQKKNYIHLSDGLNTYVIPAKVANQYIVDIDDEESSISSDDVFREINDEYTKAGALLKGVRAREGLNQNDFAKAIGVTQANLSKMENGKRRIGRTVAKRIEEAFDVNYKYFLE